MHPMQSDPGAACLYELTSYLHDGLDASGVVFSWIDDDRSAELALVDGVPQAFVAEYFDGMHKFDPLNLFELIGRPVTTVMLGEARLSHPPKDLRLHADYFARYDMLDEVDFIFWQDGTPIAALAALKRRGERPFDRAATRWDALHRLLQFIVDQHPRPQWRRRSRQLVLQFQLTAREIEVINLLEVGASNDAIGELLGISTATVKTHVVRILDKLGASNRTAAVAMSSAI
jgi:DNA-binding CsgD family transcriptional regulator